MGTLEVDLVDARGLKNTDLFTGKIDPYVIVQYRSQERKTKVAKDKGTSPSWNEVFRFRVPNPGGADSQQHKLILRIMDKDTFSKDDFLGEAQVYVGQLISTGMEQGFSEIQPTKYSVVLEDRTYCGEIRVGVKFTKEKEDGNEELGGWRHSFNRT